MIMKDIKGHAPVLHCTNADRITEPLNIVEHNKEALTLLHFPSDPSVYSTCELIVLLVSFKRKNKGNMNVYIQYRQRKKHLRSSVVALFSCFPPRSSFSQILIPVNPAHQS